MTQPNPGYLTIAGVQYVTTAEAAEQLGNDVTTDMIRDWTKRGLLKPVGRYGGRSNIYRLIDVAQVERDTRVERSGRTRRAGELQKIVTTGHNLPTDMQVDAAQKPSRAPRCTVVRDNGRNCNRLAVPDAPFRICRDHMREAYLHWQDNLAEICQVNTNLPIREVQLPSEPQPARSTFVYYIRFGDRIKIGYSADVRGRLANLPHDEVLALEPGPLDLERMRHHQFVAHRITRKGEWFRQHPDLLSHIEMLVSHFGTAQAQLDAIGSQLRPKSPPATHSSQ